MKKKVLAVTICQVIITVIFALICFGKVKKTTPTPALMNYVELEYTYNGNDIPFVICLNEVVQREEWSSGELTAGEKNSQMIGIASHESFSSILFQITGNVQEEKSLIIHSLSFVADNNKVFSLTGLELLDVVKNSQRIFLEYCYDTETDGVKLWTANEESVARFRINESDVARINECYKAWKKCCISEHNNMIVFNMIQWWLPTSAIVCCFLIGGKRLFSALRQIGSNIYKKGDKIGNCLRGLTIFAIVLGYVYLYIINQGFNLTIVYDLDSPTGHIVFYVNENQYFDMTDLAMGKNREVMLRNQSDVYSLLLVPRMGNDKKFIIKSLQFVNAYGWSIYNIEGDFAEELLYNESTSDGQLRILKNGELEYSWHEEGGICRIGTENGWNVLRDKLISLERRNIIFSYTVYTITLFLIAWITSLIKRNASCAKKIKYVILVVSSVGFAWLWATQALERSFWGVGVAAIVLVLFIDYKVIRYSLVDRKSGMTLLVLGVLCYYLPLCNSHYLFGDEYICFANLSDFGSLLEFGRIFQSLFISLFSVLFPKYIGLVRLFMCIQSYVFSLYIFKRLNEHMGRKVIAIIYTIILCYSSVMVDCVAYGAIPTYTLSLCMMVYSFILFEHSNSVFKWKRSFYIFASIFFVILACHAYQLGLTIIFLIGAIDLWYSSETVSKILSYIKYIGIMIVGVLAYYVSLYVSSVLLHRQEAISRGTIIGINDIFPKIKWFFCDILPSAISRMIAAFAGKACFENDLYWYHCEWKNILLPSKYVIWIVISLIILGIFATSIKPKNILRIIALLAIVPASYGVMLVLKENSYHTYYAYPLIAVLTFYSVSSIDYQVNALWCKKADIHSGMLGLLCIICIVQSSCYVEKGWCKNEKIIDYIDSMFITQYGHRIHIYGEQFWGGVPIYGWYMMTHYLEQKGVSIDDYIITLSDSADSCSVVWRDEYEQLIKCNLLDDDLFRKYYEFDEISANWKLRTATDNEDVRKELGILFGEDANCIVMDLNWSVYK